MLRKTHAAVGCSHCQALGARVSCPSCARPICDRCATRWESCSRPRARQLRLGVGWRLCDVDLDAQLAVAEPWRGRRRLLDLRRERWVTGEFPSDAILGPTGTVVRVEHQLSARRSQLWLYRGLRIGGVDRPADGRIARSRAAPENATSVQLDSEHKLALVVRTDEAVDVFDVVRAQLVNTVRDVGHVIHAVAASSDLDIVALGSYGRVVLFRCGDRRHLRVLQPVSSTIIWMAIGGRRLATIEDTGQLAVFAFDERCSDLGAPLYRRQLRVRRSPWSGFRFSASFSSDGQLVAVALDDRIELHRVDGGADEPPVRLDAHSGRVNLVSFARGGRLLVSADEDNRVILWPRSERGVVVDRLPSYRIPSARVPLGANYASEPTPCETPSVVRSLTRE